jgi:hypothetical protein
VKNQEEILAAGAAHGDLPQRTQARAPMPPLRAASPTHEPASHAPFAKRALPAVQVPPPRGSLGPATPSPARDGSPAAQAIDAALDAAFEALFDPAASPAAAFADADHAADRRAVAETFAGMARLHAHPLRELMFRLSVGRTPRSWAAACRPLLRPLLDAATQIGLLELVSALAAFDAALLRAADDPSAFIAEATRDALRASYERLRNELPEAFGMPDRAHDPQLVLLETLLLQVPTLQRRTLAKLYAAGLCSLSQLSQARPEELCAVAGLDRELAAAIVDHIQRFERERSQHDPSSLRARVPERLRALVERLTRLQAEFERAELVEDLTSKKAARRAREVALLELDLQFAQLGDLDLIEELKRCPVRGKIRRVESYLAQPQNPVYGDAAARETGELNVQVR